jgi:hypothetical protein
LIPCLSSLAAIESSSVSMIPIGSLSP